MNGRGSPGHFIWPGKHANCFLPQNKQIRTDYFFEHENVGKKILGLINFFKHPGLFILPYIIPVEIPAVHGHINT